MRAGGLRWLVVIAATACGRVGFTPDAPSPCDGLALSAGLIGLWQLDEGAGATTTESIAGRTGDLVGSPSWSAGRFGAALAFDGVDDQVEVRDNNVDAVHTRPITFSAWFLLADYTTGTPDIMQLRSDTPSPWHVLMSSDPSYQGISIGSGDNVWTPIKTGVLPYPGIWHHILVVFDGVDSTNIASYQIYLDGLSQPLLAAAPYGVQSQRSRIGAAEQPPNQWIGSIDDVRIYDRVVTEAEVIGLATGCR